MFDRAVAAGQTSPEIVSRLQRDVAALRHVEDEICDGDVISNSGARDGRAFFVPREEVAFDLGWLERNGLEHRILEDGRACVPSLSYGTWHFAHACGNAVQMLSRFVPPTADRRRLASMPIGTANAAYSSGPARIGGFPGGGGFFGGGGGSSGGLADLIPPAGGAAAPAPGTPSGEHGPRPSPPYPAPPPYPGPPPPEPPAVVPAPAALWLLLTGIAALVVGSRRRTVAANEAA
ncbi:MAG: hypothetical protein WD969_07390 [Paracoccaceae bacterium]